MAHIETPGTVAGNATYLTNGPNLENLSMEKSFLSPSKGKDDLLSQLRNNRGGNLKTPRARAPLLDRHNLPAAAGQTEFTPLLKSVAKKNLVRRSQANGAPQTPAFLKAGYNGNADSSVLPGAESSVVYGDDTGSSVEGSGDGTPVPQVVSSSAQSTPLAVLSRRNAEGVLADQGNMMTLREQENIINKIEKENFGLKLKIHFLEDSLRKAGPGFNEAALKENTELKVDKVTMQKELSRTRKTLNQAERDLEAYRLHLQEVQEKVKRKHVDEATREELGSLREAVQQKEVEIAVLRRRLDSAEVQKEELESLREDVDDQEAELREKDRAIEQKDEEIEKLQEEARAAIDDRGEIERLKGDVGDLEEEIQEKDRVVEAKDEAMERLQEETRKALEDLDELRQEMANKSFNTKGLSRQLEEKANKLQDDLIDLRTKHADLEKRFSNKELEAIRLQEDQDEVRMQGEKLRTENDRLRNQQNDVVEERDSLVLQLQQAVQDLQSRTEERGLLQTQCDALEDEVEVLQNSIDEEVERARGDVSAAQDENEKLREKLHKEIEQARDSNTAAQQEVDTLNEEIAACRRREDSQALKITDAEQVIGQLRTKIGGLENGLDVDRAIAQERNELQGRLKEANIKLEQLQEDIAACRHREENGVSRNHEMEQTVNALHLQVRSLEKSLGETRVTAEQRDDLHELLQDAKMEIVRLEEELAATRNREADQHAKRTSTERTINQLRAEIRSLKESISKDSEAQEVMDQLRSQIRRLEKDSSNYHEAEQQVQELRAKIHSLENDLSKNRNAEQTIGQLRTKIRSLEDDLNTARLESNVDRTIAEERKDLHEMLKDAKVEAEELQLQVLGFETRMESTSLREKELFSQLARVREERITQSRKSTGLATELENLQRSMAEERKDLHELLKDSKVETEELQLQISDREACIGSASVREKDLRGQLKRVRDDRTHQTKKCNALVIELENLQHKYEDALDNLARQQQEWEEERKAIVTRVRFSNMSVSSIHAGQEESTELKQLELEVQEKERRHQSELRGLAKQIQWIRAKCTREEGFRTGLAYEKKFLLLQIEMFKACNTVDLQMLEEIGVTPNSKVREKKPSLKAAGFMVLAIVRMKKMRAEWAGQKRLQASLARKAEQVRRQSRKKE